MSHKKEIYTAIFKRLPGTNCLIDRAISVENYNRLVAAFYYLFNSDTLTKGDYVHIFGVLAEKFPIYMQSGDKEKFKSLAISYAEFNYPPNPDIRRVITDFIDHIDEIPDFLLSKAIYALAEDTKKCNDFVGKELHARNFTLTPVSEKELDTIKSIILIRK